MSTAFAGSTARLCLLAWVVGTAACRGCAQSPGSPPDAVAPTLPAAASAEAVLVPGLPLSRPFAPALGPAGDVYVAGLVAARGVVGVARMTPSGEVVWVRDAISQVAWSLDAEVGLHASARGVAVTWRGMRERAPVRLVALFDKDGKSPVPVSPVGAGACATDDGVVSTFEGDGGLAIIGRRNFSDGAEVSLGTAKRALSPTLACGGGRVFVLEGGEADIGLSVLDSDGGGGAAPLFTANGSGEDDEREHGAFTHADGLGFVRLTGQGAIRSRDALPELSAWRRAEVPVIPEADDWLTVDGDAAFAYVVLSRQSTGRCDGGAPGADLRVVRARRSRAPKTATDADELAGSLPCGVDLGAAFTGSIGEAFVVMWSELALHDGAAPPIAGFAYRVMGTSEARRISQPADALTLAGCDAKRCYAVAMVRSDADAMAAGVAKIIAFP